MKNKKAQLKSLNTALQNIRKDEDEDRKNKKEINSTIEEGPFKGPVKALMKRKLNKLYKKSDLANFDKSGIDTKGKTPDEVRQAKSDYYHDNMNKAARAKKAIDRLSRNKKDEVQEDAPANSISTGGPVAGHDNIPLGHKMMRRVKEVTVTDRRYKLNSSKANTLKKKYRGKELLLTTFKKHAYGKSK